jgi:hypothetical protein
MKLSSLYTGHKDDYLFSDSAAHAHFLVCITVFFTGCIDSKELSILCVKDNTTTILTHGSEHIAFDNRSLF